MKPFSTLKIRDRIHIVTPPNASNAVFEARMQGYWLDGSNNTQIPQSAELFDELIDEEIKEDFPHLAHSARARAAVTRAPQFPVIASPVIN